MTTILEGYVPTFRFGALEKAKAVSISINPAEDILACTPLPRLSDYAAGCRTDLNTNDIIAIGGRSDSYFSAPRKHAFFAQLGGLIATINPMWTYSRQTLAHIDVVACVTRPQWADVPPAEQEFMLKGCAAHLRTTLQLLSPECWLLIDGKTVLDALEAVDGVKIRRVDPVRVNRKVISTIGTLHINDRILRAIYWSNPAHHLYASHQDVGSALSKMLKEHEFDGNAKRFKRIQKRI